MLAAALCATLLLPSIEPGNDPPPKGFFEMTPGQQQLAAYTRPSETKSREQVKANLQAYIDELPEVNVTSIKDLDKLKSGQSYRLARPPSVKLISTLPEFQKDLQMETGFYKIGEQWILTLG